MEIYVEHNIHKGNRDKTLRTFCEIFPNIMIIHVYLYTYIVKLCLSTSFY